MKTATRTRIAKRAVCLTDGGHPALNFINTCKKDSKGNQIDLLTNYSAFLSWCEDTNLIDLDRWMQLDLEQYCYQHEASLVFSSVITFRKTINEMFECLVKGQKVHFAVVESFNDYVMQMRPNLRYEMGENRVELFWFDIDEKIRFPFWLVVSETVKLLESGMVNKIKRCPMCGSFFLDASRASNRVWCNTRTCGFLQKNKKFNKKQKELCEI